MILTAAGLALALHEDIFPWALGPETSVMFGFIYLGAAAYFVSGVLDPHWGNAQGQLVGFLAYDLVLIGPFVDRLDEVHGGELTSLIVYTAFLAYSGVAGGLLPLPGALDAGQAFLSTGSAREQIFGGHRDADVEALGEVDPELAQRRQRLGVLHALGDRLLAEAARDPHDRLDHELVRGRAGLADEVAVDLQVRRRAGA